jgi:hypothetical protein
MQNVFDVEAEMFIYVLSEKEDEEKHPRTTTRAS